MTERQDVRPLSTEDLLPDDRNRTEGHADLTDKGEHYDDRPAGSGQYDDVAVDAEKYDNAQYDDQPASQYDEQPATHDDPTAAHHAVDHDTRTDADTAADDSVDDLHDSDDVVADEDTVVDEDTVDDEPVAVEEPVQAKPSTNDDVSIATLFTGEEVDRFRTEWRGLQADFVDSPRDAVQHADELVAQVMQSLATTFADHKRSLEGQWSAGEEVQTEELRVALRQYRAFFDKLLNV
ncbi:hypothetical protein [Umezawaea tangerina]|uniref:Uncharacterized protein n=1 Tax=Umezawaea tangerina TaxID=84725 RepID=A0A2T0SAB1_9PSEU|nr:hypothetical protein [Umezawaea tangerina]PRY30321.1 hypothetical protein CLV43_12453 [Umezawaea tangerina]